MADKDYIVELEERVKELEEALALVDRISKARMRVIKKYFICIRKLVGKPIIDVYDE